MSGSKKDDSSNPPLHLSDPLPYELGMEAGSAEIAREAAQIAALQGEIAELKDRYLRSVAETENVRKRAEREKVDSAQFAYTKFARDLLNVLDNFSRALAVLKPDQRTALPANVRPIVEGIEAIQREMLAIFDRHGIKRIDAKGQRFDPNLHSAIAEVPSAEHAPGTVIDVAQHGYTIGGRLLREAMVTIAAAMPTRKTNGDDSPEPTLDTSA